MATEPQDKKKKARNEMGERGPNPSHILLDAISGALKGGVAQTEIVLLIDMARQAYGTDQGTSWKMVAKTLREKTIAAEDDVARSLADATSTIPGEENGVAP